MADQRADPDRLESDAARLGALVRAHHRCIRIVTFEEHEALRAVRDMALDAGRELLLWSSVRGLEDGLVAGRVKETGSENPAAALYRLGLRDTPTLAVMLDLGPHLRDDRTLRAWRELVARWREMGDLGVHNSLVMIDHSEEAPAVVEAESTRFDLTMPGEAELEEILKEALRGVNRSGPIRVSISRAEVATVIKNLRGLSRRQARQVMVETVATDRVFDAGDLDGILASKRRMIAGGGLLEYIQTPSDLSQIGGLDRLKRWLRLREKAAAGEGAAMGVSPPRGVLLLGVQGSGKSLCAKAIASAWKRPLLRLDAGALYDRYVGESERRLREALKQAGAMSPMVLWIDEIEKAFASAASHSTDGGLSKRLFGSLLTWMQERTEPVFLVATANDIEALPPELLRKGRFDEIFFVDLPGDAAREQVLRIHLAKRSQDPEKLDLARLVAATAGYSGAEIEQGIIAALTEAVSEDRTLESEALVRAYAESPPLSVTMAESVAALREWAMKRCTPAQ
ncbi:MAG: AAA family ATPase [Phycisphaeraceae bacterium]|nr:AAA family ATPase [Phycisphaeraceae bacterium]